MKGLKKKRRRRRRKRKRSRVSWICGVREYGVMTRVDSYTAGVLGEMAMD